MKLMTQWTWSMFIAFTSGVLLSSSVVFAARNDAWSALVEFGAALAVLTIAAYLRATEGGSP